MQLATDFLSLYCLLLRLNIEVMSLLTKALPLIKELTASLIF